MPLLQHRLEIIRGLMTFLTYTQLALVIIYCYYDLNKQSNMEKDAWYAVFYVVRVVNVLCLTFITYRVIFAPKDVKRMTRIKEWLLQSWFLVISCGVHYYDPVTQAVLGNKTDLDLGSFAKQFTMGYFIMAGAFILLYFISEIAGPAKPKEAEETN